MNKNIFNVLNLDDDDDNNVNEQTDVIVEQQQRVETLIIPVAVKKLETRQWSLEKDKPQEVREWNIEKSKFNQHQKKGPFQRKHPFKDKYNSYDRAHFHTYSFKDESLDSYKEDTKKPTTPTNKDVDFPKLVDSSDDKIINPTIDVHTFAEKIKAAMKKQDVKEDNELKNESKNTIHMYSVIPMKTKLGDSIQFLS